MTWWKYRIRRLILLTGINLKTFTPIFKTVFFPSPKASFSRISARENYFVRYGSFVAAELVFRVDPMIGHLISMGHSNTV